MKEINAKIKQKNNTFLKGLKSTKTYLQNEFQMNATFYL